MLAGNNQCLIILLVGVLLFLVMTRPRRMRRRRSRRRARALDDLFEDMTDVKAEAAAGETPAVVDSTKVNPERVIAVTVPASMPIGEQAVGSCSYKPPVVTSCGGALAESRSPTRKTDARAGVIVEGPGFEDSVGSPYLGSMTGDIPSNYYFLDDGANGEMTTMNNMVSKSCCGGDWPTPFQQEKDPYVCGNSGDYVESRNYGNNAYQDSGCLCTTKKQQQFMLNRGNNGPTWF